MSYPVPKFTFNPGSGDIDLIPTWPPTGKTPPERQAVRTDSLTSTGLKQSINERTDLINTLNFTTVPESDLDDWQTFIDFAVAGNAFQYYPDHTQLSNFAVYSLVDTDWNPQRVAFQTYSFTLKIRQEIS